LRWRREGGRHAARIIGIHEVHAFGGGGERDIEAVTENVAKVGRFYEHLQKAMQEPWDTYTDAELKLLLRFANQGYQTMLAATEQLKAMTQAPKAKPSSKPAKAP
jgi:hypothetical protein